ncbi:MAG: hypothetical protein U9Q66_02380 [Patescibacteria group bacterium]|nr:hypothetical protein [Patescibacteria group bacterium]
MKGSSIIITILIVIILSMLGGGYYLYNENNKVLSQKNYDISELEDDIEYKKSDLRSKESTITSLRDNITEEKAKNKKYSSKIEKLEEGLDKTESKTIKIVNKSTIKKNLNYTTPKLKVGSQKLSNRDLLIFGAQVKGALSKINNNQYVLIETNTDNLKFIGDIDNRKNINLAFKRIIKNILHLNEDEINNLQFKINTKSNDRVINIYTVTF